MKHVLVPLLTPSDVTAIPTVVDYLLSVKPLTVVVVNNPSLGISPKDATAEIDKQIGDMEEAEIACAARKDYPAAEQFKERIEVAKMKRQDVLRDGWKKVPESQRFDAYDKLVAPFAAMEDPRVEYIPLTEDIGYDTLLVTLANMGTLWPNCLPKDQFSLVTPLSIDPNKKSVVHGWTSNSETPKSVSASDPQKRVQTAPKASKPAVEPPSDPREARKKELSRYMKMRAVAKTHGIDINNRPSADVIAEILEREFPAAA